MLCSRFAGKRAFNNFFFCNNQPFGTTSLSHHGSSVGDHEAFHGVCEEFSCRMRKLRQGEAARPQSAGMGPRAVSPMGAVLHNSPGCCWQEQPSSQEPAFRGH